MSKRILDLYCGGGGAGHGYYLDGFEVVGVDVLQQKSYPFPFCRRGCLGLLRRLVNGGSFVASDGRRYILQDFDAIHASPPCQLYSALKHLATPGKHKDFLEPTRERLKATGLPYVIENVVGASLHWPAMLCGTMFDLGFEDEHGWVGLRRHRLFETNWGFHHLLRCRHPRPVVPGQLIFAEFEEQLGIGRVIMICGDTPRDPHAEAERYHPGKVRPRYKCIVGDRPHDPTIYRAEQRGMKTVRVIGVYSHTAFDPASDDRSRVVTITGTTPKHEIGTNRTLRADGSQREVIRETFSVKQAQEAMGIDWLPMSGLSQAIPPAYTHFIGARLHEVLE